ncbi:uncharacterized protein FOMMEDRAFT_128984 [Fomitiporia mediterranea MF3/22]|uniref:uncharacterized protein n=1 Tax=Fomitiporia mediterranea (strain MF3/22) TaxID=694068 RepID=UPI0004409B45|nr:uncharacterized protein FOMMEDRAFT_128984 [Fomitiporia mediterranea MF3/22]EJC98674.1 hypothetical protein FOMMEDRAFT_128984 [Fomitiporia mediterranea MF3/22]
MMAFPSMYAQQAQGTLMPGQMIAVNKYNVQVERYLSQGGFAHVYLVLTAEPVLGTSHHVLKRIAVTNEAMLNDVKKEVDIMRILKGHPNIVHLIDAAWHRMPNGMFEVFILMEFCSGGGIIDMMNRRLRERLTEAEILQIFVDVCEGVAAMHNLRPALLHRDLKVENILQASPTSFKLCDFGSATPVAPRPPSTTQEIRALEADLNKHTTLQYRAPEMVDVFLRRPVDEKSDVWALGVLLYKLCYYTTPFEEHGVLAILNVQYKFPPYPVYSHQMNALIASMLREHNAHRPSVFEVLETVHKMRGTKSRFTYNIPNEPLSPRATLSPAATRKTISSSSKTPELVTSPPMNGIQAREKVLEAIAPMRRGRPSSPTKGRKVSEDAFNLLDSVEGGPWSSRPAKAHKSGLASVSTAKSPPPVSSAGGLGDAWLIPGAKNDGRQRTGTVNGFADAFDARVAPSSPLPAPTAAPRPIPAQGNSSLRPPGGDAFESLNLFPSPKSQSLTLGEAQKAASNRPSPSLQPTNRKFSISPSPSAQSPSPASVEGLILRRDPSPLLKPKLSDQALAAEQRFPSLEELDAGTFSGKVSAGSISAPATAPAPSPAPPQLPPRPNASRQGSSASFYPASVAGALQSPAEPKLISPISMRNGGVRSQQVTGTAMRDVRRGQIPPVTTSTSASPANQSRQEHTSVRQSKVDNEARERLRSPSRPMLVRKHRSSISIKQTQRTGPDMSPTKPVSGLPISSDPPKDWLTGPSEAEDGSKFDNAAVLRASPEKRASVLESPGPPDVGRAASLREAVPSPVKRKPVPIDRPKPTDLKQSTSDANKENVNGPSGRLTENWSPVSPKSSSEDEADEGPEEAVSTVRPSTGPVKVPAQTRIGHKSRQGSVHDLVDLWGGSASPKTSPSKQDKRSSTLVAPPATSSVFNRTRSTSPSPSAMLNSSATTTEKASPSKSAAPLSRKPSVASRNTPAGHVRQPSSPSKANQASTTSSSRSRPQSMLLLPVQKSVSEMTPPSPAKASLSPPPNKGLVRHRRSSISDLVSRYEAIDEQSKVGKPPPATKPARLRVVSPTSVPAPESLVSPSAASVRFPHISPSNSPKEPPKSIYSSTLEPPTRSTSGHEESRRREPSPRASSRPASPLRYNAPSPAKDNVAPATSTISASPRFERKALNPPSPVLAAKESTTSTSINVKRDEGRRSPSPERPYQGVSKLINQWQKKSEEVEGPKRGPGGGSSFRGTGSRFRREGIAASGKLS